MRWDRPQLNMRELEKELGANVSSEEEGEQKVCEKVEQYFIKSERE